MPVNLQRRSTLSKAQSGERTETLDLTDSKGNTNQPIVVAHGHGHSDAEYAPNMSEPQAVSNLKHSIGDVEYSSSIHRHHSHDSSDRPSTDHSDYSDVWADELPSITDVLELDHESRQSRHDSTSHYFSTVSAVPTTQGTLKQLEDSRAMPKPEIPENKSDASELEDALLGLDDSIAIQAGQSHDSMSNPTLEVQDPVDLEFQSGRLFFSTDSPEKMTPPTLKRDLTGGESTVSRQVTPSSKRPKLGETVEEALFHSAETEETMRPPPVIKPGLPAWVYDFDPAFIAEYQDFVDFV